MMFRSLVLREETDGDALSDALARLVKVHPKVGNAVISMGSLGVESRRRAVSSLRTYMTTGVASAPVGL